MCITGKRLMFIKGEGMNNTPFLFESGARYVGDLPGPSMSMGSASGAMPVIEPARSSRWQNADISQNAVMLSIEFNSLGTRRCLPVDKAMADSQGADPRMLRASKILLESKAFDRLKKADGKMRAWIKSRSLPSMFRDGVYLIPVPLVSEVFERLEDYQGERGELVADFVEEYARVIEDARYRLGPLFRSADYLPVASVSSVFTLFYQFIEISAPGTLANISMKLFESERNKARELWTSAAEQAVELLRGELAGLVSHLVERLTPEADGSKKEFKKGTVENLREWLSLVDARNVTGDEELTKLAASARALLNGRSPDSLRKDLLARERVRDGMGQVKAKLDTLLVAAPGRRVVVGDAGEDVEL